MTHVAAPTRSDPLIGSGLRTKTRALHRPAVSILNVGWVCVGAAAVLSCVGFVTIATTEPAYAMKHLVHVFVGLIAAATVAIPHYRWAMRFSYPLLLLVVAMLVFVLIPWVPEVIVHERNGARRWISLFVTDFQPSEVAKIAYVLALSNSLRFRSNSRRLVGLRLPLGLRCVRMGLV